MVALRDAFITGTGIFLPGEPVGNDRMEDFIGRVGGRSSVVGQRALRWNGIESRHYALTPEGDNSAQQRFDERRRGHGIAAGCRPRP